MGSDNGSSPIVCPGCGNTIGDGGRTFDGVHICEDCYQEGGPKLDAIVRKFNSHGDEDPVDNGRQDSVIPEELMNLIRVQLTKLTEQPTRCGSHAFEALHKDREHAILFCAHCGLLRIVEMGVNEDGRVPVLDVPTPVAMPEDWPKLGDGAEVKEEQRKSIELLKRMVHRLGDAEEAGVPRPEGVDEIAMEIIPFLEGLDE